MTNTGNVDARILNRYVQYLRLERSYTDNTLDAYLMDLQKMLNYYADNGIDFRNVTIEQLDAFAASLRVGKERCPGAEWRKVVLQVPVP